MKFFGGRERAPEPTQASEHFYPLEVITCNGADPLKPLDPEETVRLQSGDKGSINVSCRFLEFDSTGVGRCNAGLNPESLSEALQLRDSARAKLDASIDDYYHSTNNAVANLVKKIAYQNVDDSLVNAITPPCKFRPS